MIQRDRFEDCQTSEETYDLVARIVSNTRLSDVQETLAKQFYNIDDVVEFLYLTCVSKGNAILHGPGGFGKSAITKAFFEYFNIPIITKVGHSSMDVEALLGIPNMKQLMENSKYTVAFENSMFIYQGVLILEEFLDVRPTVAAAMKDVITEGGYRQDNKFMSSRNGPMIICSNKSPEEVSTDFSTAAFYKERFPYSKYVIWNSFTMSDYMELFNTIYSIPEIQREHYMLIAGLCAESNTFENIISPRLAIKAVDIYMKSGKIDSITYISSINISKLDEISNKISIARNSKYLLEYFDDLKNFIKSFDPSVYHIDSLFVLKFFFDRIISELQKEKWTGDLVLKTAADMITMLTNINEGISMELLAKADSAVIFKNIQDIYENIRKL